LLPNESLGEVLYSKAITISLVAALTVLSLSGCATIPQPTSTPTPTQTALASPLSAEEAWDSFAQIADNSCKKAYEGLVEEDIEGPNTGKQKIRLTFDQAGENSFAVKMPNGDVELLDASQYYACEANYLLHGLEDADGTTYSFSLPPFSADWPLKVTFDHVTATYLTSQVVAGNERELVYTVEDDLFAQVENPTEGSKTRITFGRPDAAKTAIVNDFYADMFN
jgi:hypothetical protein